MIRIRKRKSRSLRMLLSKCFRASNRDLVCQNKRRRRRKWMKRHEDVRETEEDLIKQQQEELRRKKALGKDN